MTERECVTGEALVAEDAGEFEVTEELKSLFQIIKRFVLTVLFL